MVSPFREPDRDTDDRTRVGDFFRPHKVDSSTTPERPSTFRNDGSSIKLQMGGSDREEGLLNDRGGGDGAIKRGFRGSDVSPGVIRNTPFSLSGSRQTTGLSDFDTPSRAQRLSRPVNARVRRPNSKVKVKETFTIAERQAAAQRNANASVGLKNPNSREDAKLLRGPGIASLSDRSVDQKGGSFKSITDPITGFSVPNLADDETGAAFDRFFANDPSSFNQGPSQSQIDSDPTRAAFQNRFFPSETLADVDRLRR